MYYQLIKRIFTPVNTMNIPGVAGPEINVMKIAFYILRIADGQSISNPIHSQDILDASSYPCPQTFSTSRPNWYWPLRTKVAIT